MFIAATHPFITSLEHILGFFLVLLALSMLWALTNILGFIFSRNEATATDAGPGQAPATDIDDPSEEEVAAIAACVATLMGHRSRVVSIRSSAVDWSREGRREHFASHKIR